MTTLDMPVEFRTMSADDLVLTFGTTHDGERMTHTGRWSGDWQTPYATCYVVHRLNEAHVWSVNVAEDHRGRGHGRYLMQVVIAWARAAGVTSLTLDVLLNNVPAIALYHSVGFEIADTRQYAHTMTLRP